MKTIFLSLLLLIATDPREIARVNSLKKEAEKAYNSGDYALAVQKYAMLDSLGAEDPALKLNLAHSYFNLNDTTGAQSNYQSVLNSSNKKLRSIAYQQLGIMKKNSNKLEEALQNLKSALKADPTNSGARYDYEVVKKLLEEQKKQEEEQQDEQNQEDQQNQEQKDQEQNSDEKKEGEENEEQEKEEGEKDDSEEKKDGEKEEGENEDGEEQESEKEPTPEEQMQQKLEEMNISEEKAQMILEAMRNNEVQYLQQQRRKATKRPESGKPDW